MGVLHNTGSSVHTPSSNPIYRARSSGKPQVRGHAVRSEKETGRQTASRRRVDQAMQAVDWAYHLRPLVICLLFRRDVTLSR